MPSPEMVRDYRAARERFDAAAEDLRTHLLAMAFATLSEVLPGAASIQAIGEYDEDMIPTLRIRSVCSASGDVLFDIDDGRSDRTVEDAVDRVDIEYLDVLVSMKGDEYIGSVTIAASEPSNHP